MKRERACVQWLSQVRGEGSAAGLEGLTFSEGAVAAVPGMALLKEAILRIPPPRHLFLPPGMFPFTLYLSVRSHLISLLCSQ